MPADRIVFAMTGAMGLPGGIAASNLNVLHALASIAEERRIPMKILSLLEGADARPSFLPSSVPFQAHGGSRRGFAVDLISHAPRRPLYVFDWIGLARPLLPLAAVRAVRTVIFAHGEEYWRTLTTVDRWSIRSAALNLTNSEYTLRRMRAAIGRFEGRACPLGLSPRFVLNAAVPASSDDRIEMMACEGNVHRLGARVLLLVARMDPIERRKGHAALLNILPNLLRNHPGVQMVFAGPGSDIPTYMRAARERGVASSVFIPGKVSVEMLARLYRHSYAFTMPSKQEGFGLVYLEAMNYAKPCVGCFDDGGEDVIADGETGLLVHDPNDPGEMTSVLERLLEDPARARSMGERGFQRLHARFTSAQHQGRVRAEIEPLLRGR